MPPGQITVGPTVNLDHNIVANGTTQATATLIGSQVNVFTTVGSGGAAVLPSTGGSHTQITVFNQGANTLSIYPPSGGLVDQLGVNTPLTLIAGGSAKFTSVTGPTRGATNWYSQPDGNTGGGGLTPIPTFNFLGNASGSTTTPVAVPLHPTMTVTSGELAMNLANSNTWTTTQTFAGTLHSSITQAGNTGNFRYSMGSGNTGGGHLFVDGSGNFLLELGVSAGQVTAKVPFVFAPTTFALSGTWSSLTSPLTVQGTTWTGTLSSAANGFFPNAWTHTFNLATPTNTANGVLQLTGNADTLMNNNLYVADFSANISTGVPTTLVPEIHAIRATTTINANMGGGSSDLPGGIGIGGKLAVGTSAAGTWLSQIMAAEIQVQNAGSVNYSYGANVFSSSTVRALLSDVGVAIWATSTLAGFGTALMFGDTGGSPFGTGTGTLIGTTQTSGAKINATTGIDFTNATASGNFYQDGHTTLAGSGALGFNGATAQAKPTVSGSKGANAALASLMTALAAYGLVTDTTT